VAPDDTVSHLRRLEPSGILNPAEWKFFVSSGPYHLPKTSAAQ